MDKNSNQKMSLTSQHLEILEYTDNLFTRWSLRRNTYLFKHLKPNLQLPLFILAQQRRIAQITQSQSTIIDALKLSQFVEVDPEARIVRLLELPTIRVSDRETIVKIEKIVKEYIRGKVEEDRIGVVKPMEYVMSGKSEDGFYYFVLKYREKGKDGKIRNILKDIIEQYRKKTDQKLSYTQQPLYEDLKQSITRIRKSKPNYHNTSNPSNTHPIAYTKSPSLQISNPVYSRQNMMMMYPGMYYPVYGMTGMMPEQVQMYMHMQGIGGMGGVQGKSYGVFIRKAIQSQEEEQEQEEQEANEGDGEKERVEDSASKQNVSEQPTKQEQVPKVQQKVQKPIISVPPANTSTNQSNQNTKKYQLKQNSNSSNSNSNSNGGKGRKGHHHHKQKQQTTNNKKQQKGTKIAFNDQDFPSIG